MRAGCYVTAMVAVLLHVSQSPAQPGIPPLEALVSQRSVQTELQMAPEQLRLLSQFSARQRSAMSQVFALPMNQRGQKMHDLSVEGDKGVMELLKPAQKFRLRQIHFQLMGARAFGHIDVVQELSLTNDQQFLIGAVLDGVRGQMSGLVQENNGRRPPPDVFRKQMADVDRPALEQIQKQLTGEQKVVWKDLLGKPFSGELRFGPPGPPPR